METLMLKSRLNKMSLLQNRLMQTLLLLAGAILLAASSASAVPVHYGFSSGSVTLRANLEGQTQSIFEGTTSVNVPLTSVSAVFDSAVGPFGRFESFSLTGADISIDVNESLVGVDFLDVFSPTITSLSGSDLNVFGQFAMTTQIDAMVSGTLPGGSSIGPVAIQSIGNTGSATGIVSVSGDQILISVVGVTVASFDQIGNSDPNAPKIEIKADFTFIGVAANPIPEPSAALLFGLGVAVVGNVTRSRVRTR